MNNALELLIFYYSLAHVSKKNRTFAPVKFMERQRCIQDII